MVTLTESIDIPAPYEKLLSWADNFQKEFVKWSPYHTECEMYDGGYEKGMRVRFREIVGGLDYNVTGTITDSEKGKIHMDEEKCRLTSHRYGDIAGRYVIYRGEQTEYNGFDGEEGMPFFDL